MAKDYIKNVDFTKCIIECKLNGSLNNAAVKYIEKIIVRLSRHNNHMRVEDVEDMRMFCWEYVLTHWQQYDPEKSDHCFAWFSSVIFNALKMGYKKTIPHYDGKKVNIIRFDFSESL